MSFLSKSGGRTVIADLAVEALFREVTQVRPPSSWPGVGAPGFRRGCTPAGGPMLPAGPLQFVPDAASGLTSRPPYSTREQSPASFSPRERVTVCEAVYAPNLGRWAGFFLLCASMCTLR